MTKIFNLNTMSPEPPFRWYPVTEHFRDFLRKKTLPKGLCILNRAEEKHICLDHGLDRDFFIENFLVSGVDVFNGNVYCTVDLDNIIIMGSQSVRSSVYEAIKSSQPLTRDPFISNNILFDFLENDVMQDKEEMEKNIIEMSTISPVFHLTIVKYLYMRLGQKESAQNYIGTLLIQLENFLGYDPLLEMIKIALLMLNDKKSANKIFSLLKETEEYELQTTEVRAVERYMLNKKIDNGRLLQSCFANTYDSYMLQNNIRYLCMYFDFTYARDLWEKGSQEIKDTQNLLTAAVIAEYLLESKTEANILVDRAKREAGGLEDALYFQRHYIKTGKEKEFSDKLFEDYPPKESTNNRLTVDYLKRLKYALGDLEGYNRAKKNILTSDIPAFFLLDIAFALHLFNSFADDLDEFFEEAKQRAKQADDYIALARWCLEHDTSRESEAGVLLEEASEMCFFAEDHLELGILLANNERSELAEMHLQKAFKHADETAMMLQIAEAWRNLNMNGEVRKALKKAEKVAYRASEYEDIAKAWGYWFDDKSSAERCFKKSYQTDWKMDEDEYIPMFP